MKWEIIHKSNLANDFAPCPVCGTIVSRYGGLEEVAGLKYFKCKTCCSLLKRVDE